MIITAYAITILLSIIPGSTLTSESCSNICINFVIVCWAMNMFSSLYSSTCSCIEKVKKCIRKYRAKRSKTYRIKTSPDQDFHEEKTVDASIKINE